MERTANSHIHKWLLFIVVGWGTGKTTTCGKLAAWLKQNGKEADAMRM